MRECNEEIKAPSSIWNDNSSLAWTCAFFDNKNGEIVHIFAKKIEVEDIIQIEKNQLEVLLFKSISQCSLNILE